MFNDINKITLLGNVSSDPELKYTSSGNSVFNFSVATKQRYKSGDEWKESTTYHNIVSWRNAESLQKYVVKGTRILVEGAVNTRSWEDEQGKKHYKTEVNAKNISLLGDYAKPKTSNYADSEDLAGFHENM